MESSYGSSTGRESVGGDKLEPHHSGQTIAEAARPVEARFPRYRWVIVTLLCAEPPIYAFVLISIGVLLPFIREDIAMSNSQAGLLSAAIWLAPIFLAIPGALLVVRLPPKWTFVGILAAISLLLVLHALAAVFIVLFLARVLYSIMSSLTFTPIAILRTQWIPKREMALVAGIEMCSTNIGQSLAFVGVPFLVGFLVGWRSIFLLYAGLSLIVMVLWVIFGKTRRAQEYAQEEVRVRAVGDPAPTFRESLVEFMRPIEATLRYREFVLAGFAIFGNVIPYMAMLTFWPTYLIDFRGVSIEQAGLLMAFLPIGGMTANIFNSFLSDRIGLRKPFIWPAGFLAPLCYITMVQPLPILVLGLFSFLAGYFAWCPVAPLQATLFELPGIKPKEIAASYSVSRTIQAIGHAFGPIFVGVLSDMLGGNLGLALMISTFGPASVIISGLLIRETGRRAQIKAAATRSLRL